MEKIELRQSVETQPRKQHATAEQINLIRKESAKRQHHLFRRNNKRSLHGPAKQPLI